MSNAGKLSGLVFLIEGSFCFTMPLLFQIAVTDFVQLLPDRGVPSLG
jgi:uncharacterized protein YjeT (DUF2065 family)